jgi:hypothetical protein
MHATVVSLLLSEIGRDALKFAAGLAATALIALLLVVLALLSLIEGATGVLAGGGLRTQWSPPPAVVGPPGAAPGDVLAPFGDDAGPAVIAAARAQLGRPYVWGGASLATGFDCSGLVQWAYGRVGALLPRTAQQQFAATARLRPDQLRPGDLVFFERSYVPDDPGERVTHVGLYLGGGRMVSAESVGTREASVFRDYWGDRYVGGGRVLVPRPTAAEEPR